MIKEKTEVETCPLCGGGGRVPKLSSYKAQLRQREKVVKEMRKRGFTYQDIMIVTKYKSPNSITKILKNE